MSRSPYDPIAGMYDALWDDWYLPAALPALERLFLSRMREGANVLDLCCGSGHVTRELVRRGYEVVGVDSSAELISMAVREVQQASFLVQDARLLSFDPQFDGVVSTFDSLNHMLSLGDLRAVFEGVYRSLVDNGLFLFDMNLEKAYSLDLHQWSVTIRERDVSLVRGIYDRSTKLASTELLWFSKSPNSDLWEQHKSVVEERCYSEAEILAALREAGFRCTKAIAAEDAGVTSDLGFGRLFVTGVK